MALNRDQIKGLMHLLSITREHELNCNECLDKVAELAECELAGKPIPDAFEAVRHHLTLCAECREEYDALLTVLKRMGEDEGNLK
jgi:RNA polymerase-binding transcription factor DksA